MTRRSSLIAPRQRTRQSRSGERVPPDQVLGQTERFPHLPHFVLEQVPQGFDQFEPEFIGQATDVVVGFDRCRRTVGIRSRFNHVRVESALGEEVGIGDRAGLVAKDLDEDPADDLPFFLWIGDPGQFIQESLAGIGDMQIGLEVAGESILHFLGLTVAQQAIVDEDAGELVTDGPGQ